MRFDVAGYYQKQWSVLRFANSGGSEDGSAVLKCLAALDAGAEICAGT